MKIEKNVKNEQAKEKIELIMRLMKIVGPGADRKRAERIVNKHFKNLATRKEKESRKND